MSYSFSLALGGKTYVGEGETPLEALQAIPTPPRLTAKAILTVKNGDKSKSLVYMPKRLKRLFFPNAQRILVKGLITGLK